MSPSLPLNKVVTQGQLRIGFVAGHSVIPNSDPDALLITARQLDVDMLIWGGSHRVEAHQLEGKFFINPGSATGAFSTRWPEEDEEEGQEEKEETEKEETGVDEVDSKPEGETPSNGTNTDSVDEKKDGVEDDDDDDDDDDSSNSTIPSFCLLDIQGAVCVLYIYSLIDGEVKVDKVSYRKEIQ